MTPNDIKEVISNMYNLEVLIAGRLELSMVTCIGDGGNTTKQVLKGNTDIFSTYYRINETRMYQRLV